MPCPPIQNLMQEYDLEIDDIRWYYSLRITDDLLAMLNEPRQLTEKIWSGSLSDELYRFEERYIEDLDARIAQGILEESKARELMSEVRASRRRRFANRSKGFLQ